MIKKINFLKIVIVYYKNRLFNINLVERDKYKPYASTNKSNTLYDPEKYGKQITQMIVKFSKNTGISSNYKKNDDYSLNNDLPYANYIEKFQIFDTNSLS